jgi:hypothetical protein
VRCVISVPYHQMTCDHPPKERVAPRYHTSFYEEISSMNLAMRTKARARTHTLTHTLTHALTHTHTHARSHTHTLTHTHTRSHTLTHAHTRTHTHTLTHTHSYNELRVPSFILGGVAHSFTPPGDHFSLLFLFFKKNLLHYKPEPKGQRQL